MLDTIKYEKELNCLFALSKRRSFITLTEIKRIFNNPNEALLEDIEEHLDRVGVRYEEVGDEPTYEDLQRIANSNVYLDTKDKTSYSDSIKAYLKEIGQIKLLDYEEELALANSINQGIEAEKRLSNENLTKDEEAKCKELSFLGISARKRLTEANLRLVVSIAKHYSSKGLSFLDLVQEGNIGLMKAVYKFDPNRGFRFSTYATWWIKQCIVRSICDHGRTVRIPVHVIETINKIYKAELYLKQLYKKEPTIEETSNYLSLPQEKVAYYKNVSLDILSLDQPLNEDDNGILADVLVDESSVNPLQYTESCLYKEKIDRMLLTLSPREEKIIRLRYGLEDNIAHTLEEIGHICGITRERVRQIELKAIARMRHPSRVKILKENR